MIAPLAVLFTALLPAPRAAVTFTLDFPGSMPAWAEVTIGADGSASFAARQAAGDQEQRLSFTASPATVRQAFDDAHKVSDFRLPLEAKEHVAFSGNKTLRYSDGEANQSQTFNYTVNPAAAALTALMLRIVATGEHALRLQTAAHYDPLGVLEEVQSIQSDWHDGMLAEPGLLAPVLQSVAENDELMQSARNRASEILKSMAADKR